MVFEKVFYARKLKTTLTLKSGFFGNFSLEKENVLSFAEVLSGS
jgi:hypothetical protein